MKNATLKRVLAMICVISIIFITSLSGCGTNKKSTASSEMKDINKTGYPIVSEPVTYTMMIPLAASNAAPEEMSFFQAMEQKTNVKFKFSTVPLQSFSEKKNVVFASGDLPDVFFGANLTEHEEYSYGTQKFLIPLQDLIDQYAPNLKSALNERPDLVKSMTLPDGNIYSLPYIYDKDSYGIFSRAYINDKWLKKLGLNKPTTVDEYYNVLKAFKEKDPNGNGKNDEIPLSLEPALSWIKTLAYEWGVLTTGPSSMYVASDGTVKYAFNDPRMKEELTFFNKLYKEGLFDKDAFIQSSEQMTTKMKSQDTIVGSLVTIAPQLYTSNNEKALEYTSMLPFVTKEGTQVYPASTGKMMRGTFAISKQCKNPEIMMRWVDYLYTKEGTLLRSNGKEGGMYKNNGDGTLARLPDPNGLTGEKQRARHTPSAGNWIPGRAFKNTEIPQFKEDNNSIDAEINARLEQSQDELIPFKKEPYPQTYVPIDKQSRVGLLYVDIERYVDQMYVKFIVGDENIDTGWDNFVKGLDNMGLPELIKIYQDTYDAYQKLQ